jgi:integral membrane protein
MRAGSTQRTSAGVVRIDFPAAWRSGMESHLAGAPTSAEGSGRIEVVNPRTAALTFRAVAIAEAISWIGLLAGMFVKYVPETSELGVTIFGPIHGAVFVAYLVVALLASRALRWSRRTTVLALVASVPPLVTVWFERRATGRGELPSGDAVPAR